MEVSEITYGRGRECICVPLHERVGGNSSMGCYLLHQGLLLLRHLPHLALPLERREQLLHVFEALEPAKLHVIAAVASHEL